MPSAVGEVEGLKLAEGGTYNTTASHSSDSEKRISPRTSSRFTYTKKKHNMTEAEAKILQNFMEENRPPEDIRPKLDLGFSYEKRCIELYEIRPDWRDNSIIRHHPFARIRFVQTQKRWFLFWHRASGKWQTYDPFPSSANLGDLLEVIDEDGYGCF